MINLGEKHKHDKHDKSIVFHEGPRSDALVFCLHRTGIPPAFYTFKMTRLAIFFKYYQ